MRNCPYIPETRREFIRQKRREIRIARKANDDLQSGCAIEAAFDGTRRFQAAVRAVDAALDVMDRVTKPLA